jgi:hypothetical protein
MATTRKEHGRGPTRQSETTCFVPTYLCLHCLLLPFCFCPLPKTARARRLLTRDANRNRRSSDLTGFATPRRRRIVEHSPKETSVVERVPSNQCVRKIFFWVIQHRRQAGSYHGNVTVRRISTVRRLADDPKIFCKRPRNDLKPTTWHVQLNGINGGSDFRSE